MQFTTEFGLFVLANKARRYHQIEQLELQALLERLIAVSLNQYCFMVYSRALQN